MLAHRQRAVVKQRHPHSQQVEHLDADLLLARQADAEAHGAVARIGVRGLREGQARRQSLARHPGTRCDDDHAPHAGLVEEAEVVHRVRSGEGRIELRVLLVQKVVEARSRIGIARVLAAGQRVEAGDELPSHRRALRYDQRVGRGLRIAVRVPTVIQRPNHVGGPGVLGARGRPARRRAAGRGPHIEPAEPAGDRRDDSIGCAVSAGARIVPRVGKRHEHERAKRDSGREHPHDPLERRRRAPRGRPRRGLTIFYRASAACSMPPSASLRLGDRDRRTGRVWHC